MSLKEATSNNHVLAEQHPFIKLLISGTMSEYIYAEFLYNQYVAYLTLENLAESNNLLDNIIDIKRADFIQKDLQELSFTDLKIYPSTNKYVQHIKLLDSQSLLAHLYVRHMGDMYGGQAIKKKIPGTGTMYEFIDRNNLIKCLREKLSDNLATEANLCFTMILELFTEISNEHNIQ
jgi:heme oxygenase